MAEHLSPFPSSTGLDLENTGFYCAAQDSDTGRGAGVSPAVTVDALYRDVESASRKHKIMITALACVLGSCRKEGLRIHISELHVEIPHDTTTEFCPL